MKKIGFTLAEVLVTLGIIGVIAALTIPTLMNNIQDLQFKTAWKKQFSVFSQAYMQVKQNEGGDLSALFADWSHFDSYFIKALINDSFGVGTCAAYSYDACGASSSSELANHPYKTLSGGTVHAENLCKQQYMLKDGTQVYTYRSDNPPITYGHIFVDVNGYNKGPNVLGRDLFGMVVTKDKIMPMGAADTGVEDTCNSTAVSCPGSYGWFTGGDCAGAGCAAKYLYN